MVFRYCVGSFWSVFIYASVFGDEMNRIGVCLGGVSANDIMNDSVPSLGDTIINELIEKREMNLLYHCRYQLADIVKMINAANTTDDLNLELLKVLVDDIKKVVGDNI